VAATVIDNAALEGATEHSSEAERKEALMADSSSEEPARRVTEAELAEWIDALHRAARARRQNPDAILAEALRAYFSRHRDRRKGQGHVGASSYPHGVGVATLLRRHVAGEGRPSAAIVSDALREHLRAFHTDPPGEDVPS
jgi:hypothetical protein